MTSQNMVLKKDILLLVGLLASRFFLGITEAGLFPGVIFYLTLWYTRGEQATRVALFFSCSTLAGVSDIFGTITLLYEI